MLSYELERRDVGGVAFELADKFEQLQLLVTVIWAFKLIQSAQVQDQIVM